MEMSANAVLQALLKAGRNAALEVFELADDEDVPVYPESLVHVHVARALRDELKLSSIEMEAATGDVLKAASGYASDSKDFPVISRSGRIDVVGWEGFFPRLFVEVKDEVGSSGDGIVEDLQRLIEFANVTHRFERKASATVPQDSVERSRHLPSAQRFCGIIYFVGRNAANFKNRPHLASQFLPRAQQTIDTTLGKLQKIADAAGFELLSGVRRVKDSAKDGPPDPETIGTEFEETVSGREQFTMCVACVVYMPTSDVKGPANP
jgi:hypothetical protein